MRQDVFRKLEHEGPRRPAPAWGTAWPNHHLLNARACQRLEPRDDLRRGADERKAIDDPGGGTGF